MPTILRIGSYRFFFYSSENDEPPHIHVIKERTEAKFWLNPVSIADNKGFAQHELNTIIKHVTANKEFIENEWNNYHN